jgi:dihydrofolate reductase
MRKLVLHAFDYSLDGFTAVEETGFFDFCRALPDDPELESWRLGHFEQADLHIMGRNAYLGMSQYFPSSEAQDSPYAPVLNSARKAVFSSTLTSADWHNTTIVSGDAGAEIARLKEQGSGKIAVHGGIKFQQALIAMELVDEYVISVFPYLAVSGTSLFAGLPKPQALELTSSTSFGNGMLGLVYQRAR